MIRKNNIINTLKITYPILQAPMLGVTTPEMVAAISNAGGLGSLPIGGLSPTASLQLIQKTKQLTDKSFAVNLFVHDIPRYNDIDLEPMRQFLIKLAERKGYKLDPGGLSGFKFYTYRDQLDLLLKENLRLISFTFGCPDVETINHFKKNGCILIGTATSADEAIFLENQNIDMISIQGIEAGGHRGTFMHEDPIPQTELFSLLPQIAKQVSVPCIAAGGIKNGENIKAAFDLGAAAVQIGTLFIGTDESEAIPSYKLQLKESKNNSTFLTRAFSGRWARGIRNEMMDEIEKSGLAIPPYPLQNSLTAKFRKLAQQANDSNYTNLWAGHGMEKTNYRKSAEIFLDLVKQYEALI